MKPVLTPRVERVLAELRGRRIHVLGPSGTEGSTVVEFLLSHGITTLTVHDLEPADRYAATVERTHRWLDAEGRARLIERMQGAPMAWRQGDRYLQGLEDAELVFVPQSWFRHAGNAPVQEAASRGIPLWSMTRLFFEVCPGPVLGVTGTNGKFTVVTLIGAMLEAAGVRAVVSGNDRTHVPALYALDRLTPQTWLVLEISNRQLLGLPYSPHLAVVTNISPHHLDDHGSMEAYVDAKRTIVRHQTMEDVAVINADDPIVSRFAVDTPGEVHRFSRLGPTDRGAFVEGGRIYLAGADRGLLLEVAELAVPGAHMIENALAAAAAAAAAGTPPGAITAALRAFRGLPYRFRLVGEREGVAFYEDSLATNPSAAAAAIASMPRPFYLVAGGLRKGATPEDFLPMVGALSASPVKAVYLIGSSSEALCRAIRGMSRPPEIVRAVTLESAVSAAWKVARRGEAVLLSPGCESFDQFADYRERGDRFCELVESLPARSDGGSPGSDHAARRER